MSDVTGNLFVIAAPSGAGKTSLVNALTESVAKLCISVSHTTRVARPSEVDGKDYFFVDHDTFDEMIERNAFLEYAIVFNQHYGTSRDWVMAELSIGNDVILEIDWQGARQVRRLFPDTISIFILPPSMEALQERLERRQQDNSATIVGRMQAAQDEMDHYREFDYLVINDQFDLALQDLQHIVLSARVETSIQAKRHATLLANLLQKQ